MDEIALISNAQQGDVYAFNDLVLAYQDLAYSVAYRILQDEAAADITQNSFITAYQKLDQFKGGNFKAWLLRIVTNACYDELRRQKRRPSQSLDDLEAESDGLDLADDALPSFVSDLESPENALQRSELQGMIQDCIQGLGEHHRMIVVLADIEQHSYEDIAEIENVSLGTVKSRLSRARASLRDCLQANAELLPDKYRL